MGRSWPRDGTYTRDFTLDEGRQGRSRALQIVVSHHVPEAMRLLELRAGELDALLDLPGALGRALAKPPFELVDVGSDEDRYAPRDVALHGERTVELELEDADVSSWAMRSISERNVPYRRPETYGTHSRNSSSRPPRELVVGEEPVVTTVDLARALRTRRRRHGDLEPGHPLEQAPDQRPLPRTGRPVTTKTGAGTETAVGTDRGRDAVAFRDLRANGSPR